MVIEDLDALLQPFQLERKLIRTAEEEPIHYENDNHSHDKDLFQNCLRFDK